MAETDASPREIVPRPCPCCETFLVAKSSWRWECPGCGFLGSNLPAGSGLGVDGLESLRKHNFRRLLDEIAKSRPLRGSRLLEVGCAEGWFLEEAVRRGMTVSGIEPSERHASIAARKGFDVFVGFFPAAIGGRGQYDLVVFNDVFEHLPSPELAAAACDRILRDGGALVLNLPSSKGVLYTLARALSRLGFHSALDRMWQRGFASPHISYFNAINLRMMIERHTDLRFDRAFPLATIVAEGLRARIEATHGGVSGWVLWLGVRAALPVLRLFPSDIVVCVFRKAP
jgi:SAM-dependent methyltransferase